MKETFLLSLVGKYIYEAERLVIAEDYEAFVVAQDVECIPSLTRPKTVILWQKDGKIRSAEPGDFSELE
jgi:hypothetical protein